MSLFRFLEARIAEDEAQALAAIATVAPDEWENPTRWGNFYPQDVELWDTQTPARVLAECAAKRALLAIFPLPGEPHAYGWVENDALRTLAAIYSSHPDYREEWKR